MKRDCTEVMYYVHSCLFSALTLLAGREEGRPTCEKISLQQSTKVLQKTCSTGATCLENRTVKQKPEDVHSWRWHAVVMFVSEPLSLERLSRLAVRRHLQSLDRLDDVEHLPLPGLLRDFVEQPDKISDDEI